MPLEEQRRFYDRVRGLPCKAVIEDAEQLMSSYRRDEHYYEEGGQFLPLNVWGTRGFCIEDIESKSRPEDVQQHAVLGKTFRVRILATGTRGAEGIEKIERHSAKAKAKALAAPVDNSVGNEGGADKESDSKLSRSRSRSTGRRSRSSSSSS